MTDLLLALPELDLTGVRPFFTTRRGGVSEGRYASCNLGSHVGDDPARVAANRERVMAALGLPAHGLCLLDQVHGREVVVARGAGPLPKADAVVTDQPGLVIGVMTADCLPVVLMDPAARVIGAAHAGWQGARQGVVMACVEVMETLGARRERIIALLGPCIQQERYVVGGEFVAHFPPTEGRNFLAPHGDENGKFTLDIPGYVANALHAGGLARDHIVDLRLCTHEHEGLFFSHRRSSQRQEAPCGRQMGGVVLV